MSKINGVLAPCFRCHRVLLRQYESHDLAKSHILKKELDVYRVGWIFCRLIHFIFDEVVLGNHLDIRIISVNVYRSAQSNSY